LFFGGRRVFSWETKVQTAERVVNPDFLNRLFPTDMKYLIGRDQKYPDIFSPPYYFATKGIHTTEIVRGLHPYKAYLGNICDII
jgi:hypothetical protein